MPMFWSGFIFLITHHRLRKLFNIGGGDPAAANFNPLGGGGGVLPKVHIPIRAHAHVCTHMC